MESICIILGIVALLAVIAVIGHLLWILAGTIWRAAFGHLDGHHSLRDRRDDDISTIDTNQHISQDLQAAKRLVQYARFRNWLDAAQLDSLDQLLDDFSAQHNASLDPPRPSATPTASEHVSFPPISPASSASTWPVSIDRALATGVAASGDLTQLPASAVPILAHPLDVVEEEVQHDQLTQKLETELQQTKTPWSAELLGTFMERSNIRWIEIISAALIVVCSVGLVISLWSTLSETSRYFPSLVFLLATLAIHGAGQYTLRQWKLRNTSRGILHIGLMLIPLSVLIGILLSSRPDVVPQLDMPTIAVIAVGILVYGGLAITASLALYGARWKEPAMMVIVGALTLLPIHFLIGHHWLSHRWSAITLLPLVFASLYNVLSLSSLASLPTVSAGRVWRMASQVTHAMFSASVPSAFWVMQSRGEGLSQYAVAAAGMMLAGWASWGWTASLKRLVYFWNLDRSIAPADQQENQSTPSKLTGRLFSGISWYVVGSWLLAVICSLILLAIVWQAMPNRMLLSLMLLGLALWWLTLGMYCSLLTSLTTASIALIFAIGLLVESRLPNKVNLLVMSDWLSLSRVASLTILSMLFGVAGVVMGRKRPGSWRLDTVLSSSSGYSASLPKLSVALVAGSILVFAIAAGLTYLASLIKDSQPAYGGNWAAPLLLIYGSASLLAGVIIGVRQSSLQDSAEPQRNLPAEMLVLAGQIVMLFATWRWCQSMTFAPQWLIELRPDFSWSVGGGILSLTWVLIGLIFIWRNRLNLAVPQPRLNHLRWLVMGAAGLATVSGFSYWLRNDQFILASAAGWILPTVLIQAFLALRWSNLRETALLTVSLWLLTLLTVIGRHHSWWDALGLSASGAVFCLAQGIIIFAYSKWIKPDDDSETCWLHAGYCWANDLLLGLTWLVLLTTLALPVCQQFFWSLRNQSLTVTSLVSAPITPWRSLIVAIALSALSLISYYAKSSRIALLRKALAVVPCATAVLVAAVVPLPFNVPVFLWLIAGVLVLMEFLAFTTWDWGRELADARQRQFTFDLQSQLNSWLMLTYLTSSVLLMIVTLITMSVDSTAGLAEQLTNRAVDASGQAGWYPTLLRVSVWLGPVCVFSAVCWLCTLLTGGKDTKQCVTDGYVFGAWATLTGIYAGWPSTDQILLLGSQLLASIMLGMSAIALTLTLGRNWLGLRSLDRRSSAWHLVGKACKGTRWRQTTKVAWQLWLGSIAPVTALCLLAVWLVAISPKRILPELNLVGGSWSVIVTVLSIGMGWFLGLQRGLSKFGMMAIVLGLLAPIASAACASHLVAGATNALPVGLQYVPYRLQIGLWLLALIIGLAIRIYSLYGSGQLSRIGEICWGALATLVGVLAILGINDSAWSAGQLLILSAIIAVSSEASGQTWRGYIAAGIALIAWLPWMRSGYSSYGLFYLWQALISVVVLSLLAGGVRSVLRGKFVGQEFARTFDWAAIYLVSSVSWVSTFAWGFLHPNLMDSTNWLSGSLAGLALLTWLLALLRWWNPASRDRGRAIYFAGIAGTLIIGQLVCAHFQVTSVYRVLTWWASLLGCMSIAALLLREITLRRLPFQRLLESRELTEPTRLAVAADRMAIWHTFFALFALIPSVSLVLTMSQEAMRGAAIALPLLGATAILPVTFQRYRAVQRASVLMLVSATLVLAWWADLPSAWALRERYHSWMFVQRAFLALVLLGVAYPIIAHLRRQLDPWAKTLSVGGWLCTALAGMLGLGMILGSMTGHWADYPSQILLVAKLATLAGWVGLFSRLIQFAAKPLLADRKEKSWRTTAVYAAEVVIGLGCAATYFQFPNLFDRGEFVNWWPVMLGLIAFVSMGLGHWLQRQDLPILADPVSRSSLLLPIFPLVGVWSFKPAKASILWNDFDRFAVLLMIASGLYGLHGWVRGSVKLRVLSVCFALLGFWSFLHSHPDMRFFEHPQFWLLPPALLTLLFVEWNKARLENTVVTAVRYLSILVAYLSSTAELFFKAFAGNLWPPLVLLALALCGVIAGILMRVRAFLYCGLAFIVVALIGMVWHASQAIDQVWPWWAFGIATGISLIVLLGYFEKNREKLLRHLQELKRWDT